MTPDRDLRKAPAQADFDQITFGAFDASKLAARPWFRLSSKLYASEFYANPGSRLTPNSRRFSCVYLAEDKATTVAEVWGDRFFARRSAGHKSYSISKGDADALRYVSEKTLPPLNLCDFNDTDVFLKVGIDDGTLYSVDLGFPQSWAEVIAGHPNKFDGIFYRSRHTHRDCIVAWNRPVPLGRDLEREFTFVEEGPFTDSLESHEIATKIGVTLSFVR